jgi:hypothetical protein
MSNRPQDEPCPQCGGELHFHTKQEAGFFKCYFRCIEESDTPINERSCHWESIQFKARDKSPREKAAEIDLTDPSNWRHH